MTNQTEELAANHREVASSATAHAGQAEGRLLATELDESFRLHLSPTYWQWLERFQSDPAATILHHPDLLFHDQRAQKDLHAHPGFFLQRSFPQGASWAAGVVPKTVTLPRSAGFGFQSRVQGYRLVGSRFFGNGDIELQQTFQDELENFLQQRDANFLLLEDVLQPSQTWSLLTSRPNPIFRMEFLIGMAARFRIRLPQNPDDYWRGFSKNARKQNRRLLEENRRFTLWRATSVDHVPELLAAVKQVVENSWQAERMRVRICQDESRFDLLTFLANHGALRSYVLFDGQTPIAFELDHQWNGEVISEEAAYDQRYAECGPGRTLLLRVLQDLFEQDPPAWYDFAAGDWDYKRRFANDQSLSAKLWLVKRDLRFGLISLLMQTDRTLRSNVRRLREYWRARKSLAQS